MSDDPWVDCHSWEEMKDWPFKHRESGRIYIPSMEETARAKLSPKYNGPDPHFHVNKLGVLEACYHKCRSLTTLGFWVGLTLGFPLEHLLWEKAPLFSNLTHWMGL